MVTVDGGPVVAHAQAFADEINRRWGFTHILTYPGHQPDQQHALDNFQTRDVMLQLAEWCTHDDVIDHYGIDYVIFDVYQVSNAGEIYNREIARHWRTMEDRGSPTQNHHDHVHVSFNKTAQHAQGDGDLTPEEHQRLVNAEKAAGEAAQHAANAEAALNRIETGQEQFEKDIAAIKTKLGA